MKLDGLLPQVREKAEELLRRCSEAGLNILVTCTLRTVTEQDRLYAQGRSAPGPRVTNAKGGYSWHNFGRAFDCVVLVNGKPDWAVHHSGDWQRMGSIGRDVGLEWGGDFNSIIDLPHFQLREGLSLQQARSEADIKKV